MEQAPCAPAALLPPLPVLHGDRLLKTKFAECQWLFGLALVQHDERERALPLLRTAVAYEQEIGHAKAAEHAALLERLEAGEALPLELRSPMNQRVIGGDSESPASDYAQF